MSDSNVSSETDIRPEETGTNEASETNVAPPNSGSESIRQAIEKAQATIDERDTTQGAESEKNPLSDAARTLASAKKTKKAESKAPTDIDQGAKVEEKARAETVQPEGVRVDPPHFWSPDRKQLFARAEPELQKAILAEVQRTEEWARGIAHEAKDAVQLRDGLHQIYEPHQSKFKAYGIDNLEATSRLMGWQEQLDTDPIPAFNRLLRTYGLTPEHLINGYVEEPIQDPAISEATRRIQELESQIQAMTSSAQGQRLQSVQSQIDKFLNATDDQGNLLHPYVEQLKPQIAKQIQILRASNPDASDYEVLRSAYLNVVKEFDQIFIQPKLSTLQVEQQKQEQNIKRAEQAKRAASASIKGSPAPGAAMSRPKVGSFNEAMERAWSQMTGA